MKHTNIDNTDKQHQTKRSKNRKTVWIQFIQSLHEKHSQSFSCSSRITIFFLVVVRVGLWGPSLFSFFPSKCLCFVPPLSFAAQHTFPGGGLRCFNPIKYAFQFRALLLLSALHVYVFSFSLFKSSCFTCLNLGTPLPFHCLSLVLVSVYAQPGKRQSNKKQKRNERRLLSTLFLFDSDYLGRMAALALAYAPQQVTPKTSPPPLTTLTNTPFILCICLVKMSM